MKKPFLSPEGKFEYVLEDVNIPEGVNNLFTVEAIGAKNLNVRVKMLLWMTKSSEASGNTATVSQSNVPPGTYTIKIDGDAGEGVSQVNLKISASLGIEADSNGDFSYSYNTKSVPPGNFEINVGGITKGINLLGNFWLNSRLNFWFYFRLNSRLNFWFYFRFDFWFYFRFYFRLTVHRILFGRY